jgi:hypothetical protein
MTLADAKEAIEASFSASALQGAAAACRTAASSTHSPELVLVHYVCLDLARTWSRPVSVQEADELRDRFAGHLASALASASAKDAQHLRSAVEALCAELVQE